MNPKVYVLTYLLLLIAFTGCSERQDKAIDEAYRLSYSNPDSALTLLKNIDVRHWGEAELARYALVYTIAQDKSGTDVDQDSLLRTAYNYYQRRPTEPLYAKCMYYMGKYLQLNDSTERALQCYSLSFKSAKQQADYYTHALALQQSSVILREYAPEKAIRYAQNAVTTYNKVKHAPEAGQVYALLNLAECLFYGNRTLPTCLEQVNRAIEIATACKDSCAIADAYQDLSVFYSMSADKDAALRAALLSYRYRTVADATATLALGRAYYEADSTEKAKALVGTLSQHEKQRHAKTAFTLLHLIAMKEHDYDGAEAYVDSAIARLEQENASNAQAKDNYYRWLLQKEQARARAQADSMKKNTLIIVILVSATIIIAFGGLLYLKKKEQDRRTIEEEQARHRIELEHKEVQIATMRQFLIRKIAIVQKLEALGQQRGKDILLSDDDWQEIEVFLNSTGNNFVVRLQQQFPDLTAKDLHFLMLLKLNLPYPDIATIYHIEIKSIKQKLYLLKGKLGLEGSRISTRNFIKRY